MGRKTAEINFNQIFTFGGILCPSPFTMVYAHMLNFIWIPLFSGWKTAILGNFPNLGSSCTQPLHQWWQNLVCWCSSIVCAYTPNFVSVGIFCCTWVVKTPNFTFFGLQRFVVSLISDIQRKLNVGTQLQTFPHPTVSKLFLYSKGFMAKLCARTLSFKSWRTRKQVNEQKTHRFWSPRWRVMSKPHHTCLDDRGPQACSCIWVLLLGGWKFGWNHPLNLKLP